MIQCKVCGKEYKQLHSHITKGHGITQEDYDKLEEYVGEIEDTIDEPIVIPEDMTEEEAKAIVSGQGQMDNIFKDSVIIKEKPEDDSISTILSEFNLTYKELRAVITAYSNGVPVDVTQTIERNQMVGVDGADKLKNLQETTTINLNVAEELVKAHGFVVTEVKGSPKTWYLQKQ